MFIHVGLSAKLHLNQVSTVNDYGTHCKPLQAGVQGCVAAPNYCYCCLACVAVLAVLAVLARVV